MKDFWDAYSTVKSPNGFGLLRIDADTTLSPAELAIIKSTSAEHGSPENVLEWLELREQQASAKLLQRPKQFHRLQLADNMQLFAGRSRNKNRKLLITFMGVGSRFMMPKSVFLQQFDPDEWIILCMYGNAIGLRDDYDLTKVERTEFQPYFSSGEMFKTAEQTARDIKKAMRYNLPKVVVCAGICAAGAFAMQVAVCLSAKMGISISSFLDENERFVAKRNGERKTRLVVYHGQNNPIDKERGVALEAATGAERYEIPGVYRHNPFRKLLKRGQVNLLMPALLDPSANIKKTIRQYTAKAS